jgi:hypothetical protein
LNTKENYDHRIDVVRLNLHRKTVHLKEKGGIPWETKAGKRIKTKLKNRKPNNRKKRTKRNSRRDFFYGRGGLRLGEAHNSYDISILLATTSANHEKHTLSRNHTAR